MVCEKAAICLDLKALKVKLVWPAEPTIGPQGDYICFTDEIY